MQNVSSIMPEGFTDEDFLQTFKSCYTGLWYAIQDRKSIYDMMDAQRVKNKLSIAYKHPKPEIWFMQRSQLLGVLG